MRQQNTTLILITFALGTVLGTLNSMMFNVALPTMSAYFSVPLSSVQWLTSGYLLAAGSIIPAAGFLGDRFGYKRIYCSCLAAILALSIIGAFAWCIEALIVVRFLFGLTAGLLAPMSLTLLYRILPTSMQTTSATIWGMSNMVGGLLPTVLAGVILDMADWRFLLLFNLPFVILALLLSVKVIPGDVPCKTSKLDVIGLALLSSGSFALLFTFSNLSNWGFSVSFFAGLALSIGLLFIYVQKNKQNDNSVLNLNVFRYPRYAAAFFAGGINIIALVSISFLMPLFLQSGLGVSPLITGLVILPGSLCSLLITPVARRYYPRLGEKLLTVVGVSVIMIGSVPFWFATPLTPLFVVIPALCFRCFGMGAFNLVITNAQMSAIPIELSGHASAVTNWSHTVLNALMAGVVSNIIDLRLASAPNTTAADVPWIYTSTTNILMIISCLLLAAVIPVALKFFRSKSELRG